jgi:hypothetical protein
MDKVIAPCESGWATMFKDQDQDQGRHLSAWTQVLRSDIDNVNVAHTYDKGLHPSLLDSLKARIIASIGRGSIFLAMPAIRLGCRASVPY